MSEQRSCLTMKDLSGDISIAFEGADTNRKGMSCVMSNVAAKITERYKGTAPVLCIIWQRSDANLHNVLSCGDNCGRAVFAHPMHSQQHHRHQNTSVSEPTNSSM
jgi:hypothetical protein